MTHRPPRVVVALSALLLVATFGGFTHPRVTVAADSPFVDISASTFKADIEWLWAQKITVGCEPTRYCPNQLVTRGQMASFLVRMFKLTEGADVDAFTDDETSSHEANINRLAYAGITTGCDPTRFCPTALVTRAEMASFLARAVPLTIGDGRDYFRDDNGLTHEPNIDRIAAAGITTGCARYIFCPQRSTTRAEMAGFLHRVVAPTTPPPYPAPGPATAYVAISGSDVGNSCLVKSKPCRTLAHAIEVSIHGDTIDIGPGTFREQRLLVKKALTINGDPGGGTIFTVPTGTGTAPIFLIKDSAATLVNLTITGNRRPYGTGGAISVYSSLTLIDSTISNNVAGAGGGIAVEAPESSATIIGSTIAGNSADSGGGIYSQGTLTIVNSTISGNRAGVLGGGLLIVNTIGNKKLVVHNSTITGNSVPSSGFRGGGIGATGTFEMDIVNSVIVGNTAPTGQDIDKPVTYRLASIIGIPAGLTLADVLDPAGLRNNGGPTKTIALSDSAKNPAIDKGNAAACAAEPVNGLDQRGLPRTPPCDIGAYELQP